MAPKHTISEAYQLFFQNLFNFNGRTSRSDSWRVVIINSLVAGFIAGIFAGIFGEESATASTISSLINIAVWVLELGIVVRRLHDTGRNGPIFFSALFRLLAGLSFSLLWLRTAIRAIISSARTRKALQTLLTRHRSSPTAHRRRPICRRSPQSPRLHSHSLQLLLFSLLNPLRHLLPHLRQSPLPLPRQAPHTAQAAGLRFRSAAIIARTAAHP
jgi:uncharacterized membrane protein YhaH (DUF805 family)